MTGRSGAERFLFSLPATLLAEPVAIYFTGAANGFETHTGSCGLTMALTRNLGIFGSYTYYGYSYEEDALPPGLVGLPYQTNRHSVQASLVVWAPLFYRPRKPNVTR